MDKKKRIITAIVMLAVYFLIHILFIKDGTLTALKSVFLCFFCIFSIESCEKFL